MHAPDLPLSARSRRRAVGSKTGSITGVTNDVGFIAKDGDALVLSIFCESLPDQHVGEKVIGDIARAAMRATGIVDPLWSS